MTRSSAAEIATGALVLAAAAAFLVYGGQAAGLSARAPGYELTASFRSAEGIGVGSDVRLAGVKVGSVTALQLDPATFRAETRFSVREGLALPDDSAALVSSEGLLGEAFLELVPGRSAFDIEPGGEVLETQSSVSLVQLLLKFVAGSGSQ